jgi:hypothetical protein
MMIPASDRVPLEQFLQRLRCYEGSYATKGRETAIHGNNDASDEF